MNTFKKWIAISHVLIFLNTTSCFTPKEKAEAPKVSTEHDFNFDRQKAAQAASDLMEKFWKEATAGEAAKPENNPKSKLDIAKPQFIARNIVDCSKVSRKMVTVVFPDKVGTGSAWARLFLETSGTFTDGQNIGDTTDSVEQTLIHQSKINCDEEEP